jgi:DNA-binding transcriptional regulator GbsR (MarR family)
MNPKTQTFKNPDAAIANAKKLFEAGGISKSEFLTTVKKLQETDLRQYMAKKYPAKKK